jgi:hypothetical protein
VQWVFRRLWVWVVTGRHGHGFTSFDERWLDLTATDCPGVLRWMRPIWEAWKKVCMAGKSAIKP